MSIISHDFSVCPVCGMGACEPVFHSQLIAVDGSDIPFSPDCIHAFALIDRVDCPVGDDASDEDRAFCFCGRH